MFKRLAWILMVLLLLPVAAHAQKPALDGRYYPPESPNKFDLDKHSSPADQLNRDVKVLRTTSKAQLNKYVPRVYAMRNVNPFAVVRYVRRVVQAEEGAIFTFVSPDGNGGRILVAVPEYQLESLDRLVAEIDRPGLTSSDGTRRIYRQLKHRRANISFNPLLDDSAFINSFAIYLTNNESIIITDPEQNAVFIQDGPSGADYLDLALTDKLDTPTPQAVLTTKVYDLNLKNNSRIGLDYIAWKNGPGSRLFAFGAFNETGGTHLRHGNPALLLDSNGINNIPSTNGGRKQSFDASGNNFAYTYEVSSAFFDFLATRGKARVLSSGTVAALNSRSASITAGDQILFYPVSASDPSGIRPQGSHDGIYSVNDSGRNVNAAHGSSGSSGNSSTSGGGGSSTPGNGTTVVSSPDPDFIVNPVTGGARFIQSDVSQTDSVQLTSLQTGLKINLTPLIYENGLDVSIQGHVSEYNGFDDRGQPVVNGRQFAQSIRMGEGQEVVLGGLMRETSAKMSPKIPILGSIPFIGSLFGGETTNREQSEVVISISADKIVRYDGKDYGVTKENATTIKRAEGSEPLVVPKQDYGFDQHGFDREKAPYVFGIDKSRVE